MTMASPPNTRHTRSRPPLQRLTYWLALCCGCLPLWVGTASMAAPATPATPAAPSTASERFDLVVNNAPASQVFMQLASGSPYSMLVSPEVAGQITITLKNTTVLEALEYLRELFGYDYRVTGNRIVVQPNTVQTRLFRINYLPGRRQGGSDVRVSSSSITQGANTTNTNYGSPSSGSSSSSQSTGPRAEDTSFVRTTSDADFWKEVQASLNALVGSQDRRSVVLNPSAGVIVVKATPGELRSVEQYLKQIQVSIERQVMIEAKILEVELSQDAQSGVNWAAFGNSVFGSNSKLTVGVGAPGATLGSSGAVSDGTNSSSPGATLNPGALGRGFYGLAFQAANFAAMLNFLNTQGNVSVLSSPRIATLNNQKAVLKVGSDELFVTGISSSTTTTGSNSTSTPSVTLQPFFSGIALDVTPQIDEDGQVMLHVHPTISTVTEKVKNIDLGALGAYRLPLAASTVNETDSIVRVNDGHIVAIGGLMLEEKRDGSTGVPVLADAPLIGGLFRQKSVVTRKRELVILMKPTVIRDDASWPDAGAAKAISMTPMISAPVAKR